VRAYYNEIDPFAVATLRELISAGHIAPGDVDERSITDVTATDLRGYTQCHFFAGVGVWSYALRLAGWPDSRPVWTGSCPCQPFSSAGKGRGFDDERHLWPYLCRLIAQCRPAIAFGEQVAQKAGAAWFDAVQLDLAREDYASGMEVFPACGVGAPHMRQRLYWFAECMADAELQQRQASATSGDVQTGRGKEPATIARFSGISRLADAASVRRIGRGPVKAGDEPGAVKRPERLCDAGRPGPVNGHWRDADWIGCTDGRFRPVEPGTFPLVNGAAARVGRLRVYGNAIVAQQAAAWIGAYLDAERDEPVEDDRETEAEIEWEMRA